MKTISSVAATVMFICSAGICFGQDGDLEGSKDHPMFNRMSNFFIGEYETNFDRVEMNVADGSEKGIEGEKTQLYYFFD